MASDAARVEALLTRGRFRRAEAVALGLGAVAIALGVAAWVADTGQGSFAAAALPASPSFNSFGDRFSPLSSSPGSNSVVSGSALSSLAVSSLAMSVPAVPGGDASVPAADRFASATLELRLQDAKGELSRQLATGDWRSAPVDGSAPVVTEAAPVAQAAQPGVPLPRPRPSVADQQGAAQAAENAARSEDRSLLQKLSDLLPGRVRLASLTPDSGLFSQGPDLAALGYDRQTAVYDISARAVYLPGGLSLEAHSGMGNLKDDPEHVQQPMVGATPPAIYELKPREKLFHGVAALRMTPIEGTSTFGRSGLLAHSYMLGPNGDSNGCVSIKNYDRFLKAYTDGEVNRMVVVPSLSGSPQATQRASSDS
jgi:Protein of unknown function (DUF2778)